MAKTNKTMIKIWNSALWWMSKNKKESYILIGILLVGTFVRMYKIGDYMTFLGDEGRDAIVVRRLLVEFDPILIGPGTSIGNMYLGPLYYYMMAPALLLSFFSPVGPAVMIATLGVLTIWFIWYVTREFFPLSNSSKVHWGSLVAAFLYSLSPTAIIYSRSSWNPNIMPFFALLAIFSVWKYWSKREFSWIVVASVALAFGLQSHYLGLLLFPVAGLFWYLTWRNERKAKRVMNEFYKKTWIASAVFAFLMSPLVIFDARHGWNNFAAIKKFFVERQTTVSAKPWNALPNLWPRWLKITNSLFVGEESVFIATLIGVFLVITIVWLLARVYTGGVVYRSAKKSLFLLTIWLLVALVGLGVYKQEIYSHYYGFFQTAPYILIGILTGDLLAIRVNPKIQTWLLAGVFMLPFVSLSASPLKYPPNRQKERAQVVARKILKESGGDKFNLAVLAERNYEDGYQYFLEKEKALVVDIDAQRTDETVTDQLFVVCELPREKCDPTHSGKAEVTGFGWTAVADEWDVFGVTLYKLEHSNEL